MIRVRPGSGLGAAVLVLAGLLAGSGCDGDAERAALELELAPAPGAGSEGCDEDVGRADLPAAARCIELSVCRIEGEDCEPVPLVAPEESHDGVEPGTLVVDLDASLRFEADAQPGDGPHRVRVVLRDEMGVALAEGTSEGVRFGRDAVRVRLHTPGEAACAGPRAGGEGPARPRALHAAVPLPNGDVLVFGGVTGEVPSGPGANAMGLPEWRGAPLQREIEVYRPREGRFLPVEVDGTFGRALFASALLDPEDPAGPYRIRVVGGFTAEGAAAAVRFDAVQGNSYYGAPLLPAEGASVADSVDLVYDPAALTVRVEPAAKPGNPRAGANRIGEWGEPPSATAVVLGLTDGVDDTPSGPRPRVAKAFWFMSPEGEVETEAASLEAARFGGTVSRVGGAGDAFLVWGGNVDLAAPAEVEMTAGELLRPGLPTRTFAGGTLGGLPDPSAFHTATRVEAGVLIAGGLRVGCTGDPLCMGRGVSTLPNPAPLTVLRYDGAALTQTVVAPEGFTNTFLHDAVSLPLEGGGEAAVLVGGAYTDGGVRMAPSGQVVRVVLAEPGRYEAAPLAPGLAGGLIHPRWGHVVTALDGDRLLVTGGFELAAPDGTRFRALGAAEVLPFGPAPEVAEVCGGGG